MGRVPPLLYSGHQESNIEATPAYFARHRNPLRMQNPIYMKDWAEKLDAFLQFNQRDILQDMGRISAEVAKSIALEEYEKFRVKRIEEENSLDYKDFEKAVKKLEHKKKK